ncbi:MAG: hypothetical protein KGJ23_15255 [Euryarchaeota archaeon]|nr:hypothetical protein [Euryarchaeota archaeon]MDE2046525.1 hypothetical protein [Thermoplasmata archaeon]
MTPPKAPRVLKVADAVGPMLVLRETAASFFSKVNSTPSPTVVVDFSGTTFMSRSFAHEYLVRKAASRKSVHQRNVPEEARRMLALVREQRRVARSDRPPAKDRLPLAVAPVSSL